MRQIKFCKFHGFGNDYVVIEAKELAEISDIVEFTKQFCHRNTGVGSDGIAILEKLDEGDGRFFVPDHQSRRQRSRIFRQRDALCGGLRIIIKICGQTKFFD